MKDNAGAAQGEPDFRRPTSGRHSGRHPGAGTGVSRRRFLRAAVAGGVAIGVASLGYWGAEYGLPLNLRALPRPSPRARPSCDATAHDRIFRVH